MPSAATHEGEVPFPVKGIEKECKTWYKIVGDLSRSARPALVVLHGGPGGGHEYLLCLSELWDKYSVPVVFYDQVGCGNSTHLPGTKGDETLWQEQLFIDELDNLIDHLDLRANGFHIFGQSWGGMLGSTYASSQPSGLRRLILANSPADLGLASKCIRKLRLLLPEDTQEKLRQADASQDYGSASYMEAVEVFYRRHFCRVEPWPAHEVQVGFKCVNLDPTVYMTMNGPSELTMNGTLRSWSIMDRAHLITAPTLIYNGSEDEMQDECVAPLFWKIPKAKWITIEGTSHFTHAEKKDRVVELVGDFLVSNEGFTPNGKTNRHRK